MLRSKLVLLGPRVEGAYGVRPHEIRGKATPRRHPIHCVADRHDEILKGDELGVSVDVEDDP
eukprot:4408783-Pyramimonas_sp.AAC.1